MGRCFRTFANALIHGLSISPIFIDATTGEAASKLSFANSG
jgi:hypothetical protein